MNTSSPHPSAPHHAHTPVTPAPKAPEIDGPRPASTAHTGGWRSTARAVAADAVPPLLIFYVLHALGVADVIAYLAGAIVPLGRLLIDRWRGRSFNAVSGLVAVFLVVSVVLAAVTHDPRAVMARGGVIYLAIALVFAGSLVTRHPLMLLISRYFTVRTQPDAAAAFDARYRANPRALRAMRLVTAAWAVGFGVSAIACVICAYTLPITLAATVTSLLEPTVAIVLAAATLRYLRRAVPASASSNTASAGATIGLEPPTERFRSR
jgi:hypothetical protein